MDVGKQKFTAIILLASCVAVLLLARWLEPDPRGFGTHQQLRLPPCAFQKLTGIPCVTCGMTTAFAHCARGEFRRAFAAQPFGLLLFVLTIGLALDSAVSLTTGRSLRDAHLPWKLVWAVLTGLLLLAWAYKIWKAEG